MKTFIAIAVAAAAMASIPSAVVAAPAKAKAKPAHKATKVATTYECVKCHMSYTAAEAKKDHYKCDMDGGKLVPVKTSAKKSM